MPDTTTDRLAGLTEPEAHAYATIAVELGREGAAPPAVGDDDLGAVLGALEELAARRRGGMGYLLSKALNLDDVAARAAAAVRPDDVEELTDAERAAALGLRLDEAFGHDADADVLADLAGAYVELRKLVRSEPVPTPANPNVVELTDDAIERVAGHVYAELDRAGFPHDAAVRAQVAAAGGLRVLRTEATA